MVNRVGGEETKWKKDRKINRFENVFADVSEERAVFITTPGKAGEWDVYQMNAIVFVILREIKNNPRVLYTRETDTLSHSPHPCVLARLLSRDLGNKPPNTLTIDSTLR